jgi:hypothetical protein
VHPADEQRVAVLLGFLGIFTGVSGILYVSGFGLWRSTGPGWR